MKKATAIIILVLLSIHGARADSWIRINQLGYLPGSVKVAVYISQEPGAEKNFTLFDALTDRPVFSGTAEQYDGSVWGMSSAARLDFTQVRQPGGYYIEYGRARSETFRIGSDVYDGTADFLLNYIRQQRCGYNPLDRKSVV